MDAALPDLEYAPRVVNISAVAAQNVVDHEPDARTDDAGDEDPDQRIPDQVAVLAQALQFSLDDPRADKHANDDDDAIPADGPGEIADLERINNGVDDVHLRK